MLAEALRLVRVFHDMKQNELAERLQISKSYLSEIESGKKSPTIDLIDRYSREFAIPVSSIMFFAEELESPSTPRAVDRARGTIAQKIINFLRLIEDRTENVRQA